MSIVVTNNVRVVLTLPLASSATSLTVSSLDGLPDVSAAGAFTIFSLVRQADDQIEYVKATGLDVPTRTYTIERAQENTIALDFVAGDEMRNFFTAGMFETLADSDFVVETSTDMQNIAFPVGKLLVTKGFSVPGDGGGASYLVESGDTSNGFDRLLLTGGNTAVYQISGIRNLKQFGAKGDGLPGSDDTGAIHAAYASIFDNSQNGTILAPAGKYMHTGITTKKGVVLVGEGRQSELGTEFFLKDGSNADSFTTQAATFTQFEGFRNLAINGNKANQTGNFHGINAFHWDIANVLDTLSIADCGGSGIYFDNTGTQTGTVVLRDINCNRNDQGGIKVFDPVQQMYLCNVACEGNGLDGTGASSGSNFVFESMNDTTHIHLVNCRGEARAQVNGGGIRHLDLIDNNNANIFVSGGYWSVGNDWVEHFKITTSGSRVELEEIQFEPTTTTIINDVFLSETVSFSNSNANTEILYNVINKKQRDYTHNGVAVVNNLIIPVSDSGAGTLDRDIVARIIVDDKTEVKFLCGAATPQGNVTANPGSIFLRIDGGASQGLYVKESGTGNTGWVAK